MLGDCRLRDAGAIRQRPHGLLSVADQSLEDRTTGRIGEDLEEEIGRGLYVSIHNRPIINNWMVIG